MMDYVNHIGHADHDPAKDYRWQPLHQTGMNAKIKMPKMRILRSICPECGRQYETCHVYVKIFDSRALAKPTCACGHDLKWFYIRSNPKK
jgi:hypothetical protein